MRMELGSVRERLVSWREELRAFEGLIVEVESKKEESSHVEAALAERGKEATRISEELRALEGAERNVSGEVRTRKEELEKSLGERVKELRSAEMRLESIKTLTRDYNEELEAKEKEYDEIVKSMERQSATFRSREKDLWRVEAAANKAAGDLGKTVRELDNATQRAEQLHHEIEASMRERSSLQDLVQQLRLDLESVKGQIHGVSTSIVAQDTELNTKEKLLGECENAIKEKSSLLDSKNRELASVEVSVEKAAAEL